VNNGGGDEGDGCFGDDNDGEGGDISEGSAEKEECLDVLALFAEVLRTACVCSCTSPSFR